MEEIASDQAVRRLIPHGVRGELFQSEVVQEGVGRFLEKRPPKRQGQHAAAHRHTRGERPAYLGA